MFKINFHRIDINYYIKDFSNNNNVKICDVFKCLITIFNLLK